MSEIPARADDIDAAWLTGALASRHPGVRVEAVRVAEAHEATNAHAILEPTYAEAAGAPAHLFCKLLPGDPRMRPLVAATGMGRREARFYAELAPKLSLRTPRVHGARHEPRGEGFVLLLEDLASTGCRVSDGTTGVAADAAAVALEELAGLHLRYLDPALRAAEADWVGGPMHDPSYAGGMLGAALAQRPDALEPAFAEVSRLYLEAADAIHGVWQQGPSTVIHGDTHIGNLFFDDAAGGRVGFLDWGILSTGTPLRDVSYFLAMALDVEVRRAHEHDLLRHYLEIWNAGSRVPIDFDGAWESHRVHAAYTVVASCQAVQDPSTMSPGRRRFADAFVSRASAIVDDLESAAAVRAAIA